MKQDILQKVVKNYAYKSYRTILVAHTQYSQNEWEMMKKENKNFESE
jgi:hypothetical protein